MLLFFTACLNFVCSNNLVTGVDGPRIDTILVEWINRVAEAPTETRRPWTRLSKADRSAICARDAEGESWTAMALEYNVAKSTVFGILGTGNVVVRRQGLTLEQVREAAARYRSGRSLSQVATGPSLKQDTIRLALTAAGVALRFPTGGSWSGSGVGA